MEDRYAAFIVYCDGYETQQSQWTTNKDDAERDMEALHRRIAGISDEICMVQVQDEHGNVYAAMEF